MRKTEHCNRKAGAVALLASLSLAAQSAVPLGVSVEAKTPEYETMIQELLSAGEYVEGEALVVLRKGKKLEDSGQREKLSKVDGEAVELAIRDNQESGTAYMDETTKRVRVVLGDDYTVQYVVDHNRTTAQLLNDLYQDTDVVAAEPNYLIPEPEDTSDVPEEGKNISINNVSTQRQWLGENTDGSIVGSTENVSGTEQGAKQAGDLTSMQWYVNDSAATNTKTPNAPLGAGKTLGIPGWNGTQDNASGTICIMDTGIDTTHPDLQGVLYTFTEEQQKKYGCGPHGINVNRKQADVPEENESYIKDISDHFGHGTHLAGIVAAQWNGEGISGIAKGAKIFGVRVFGSDGSSQSTTDIVRGFQWLTTVAKEVNLKAVNLSLGTMKPQLVHTIMVNQLGKLGVNTVYASGNSASNMDETVDLGGQNNSPYAITVNAADQDGKKTSFSCYGQMSTDVFATGVQMLSTIPQKIVAGEEDDTYKETTDNTFFFPETTDKSHLAGNQIENFQGNTPSVHFFHQCPVKEDGSVNQEAKEVGKVVTGDGLGAGDKVSWAIPAKSLNMSDGSVMAGGYYAGRSVWMAVPVESAQSAYWLSVKGAFNDDSHVYSGIASILCEKDNGNGTSIPVKYDMQNDSYLAGGDLPGAPSFPRGLAKMATSNWTAVQWTPVSLNLHGFVEGLNYTHNLDATEREKKFWKDPGKVNGIYLWEKDGTKYMLAEVALSMTEAGDGVKDETMIYLDDVAVGDSQASTGAYQFMNGTSMAAPSVAACLAIIAKGEPESASLSEEALEKEALERAGKLLASVDYEKDLEAFCRTGGRVNLHGQSEFTKKAPIISRATVNDGTLTLNGYFFSESGEFFVDDKAFAVSSRQDGMLTADVSGLAGGSHVAKVVNADGAVSRILFHTSDASGGVSLYEKTHALPLNAPELAQDYTDGFGGNLVVCQGALYIIATDAYDGAYALWRYNLEKDTWSRCQDLPKSLRGRIFQGNGMVTYQEKLYLYSSKRGFDDVDPELWCYEPTANTWNQIAVKELPRDGLMFILQDEMFFASYSVEGFVKVDIHTGKVEKVNGTLPIFDSLAESRIAVSGEKLYMLGNFLDYETDKDVLSFVRFTYNQAKKQFTSEDISKTWDASFGEKVKDFTLAGLPNGIAIVGPSAASPNKKDTHMIKNTSVIAEQYGKTSSYHEVYAPKAVYDSGRLYVMGMNDTESDILYLRSTFLGINPLQAIGKTVSVRKGKKTILAPFQVVSVSDAKGAVTYEKKSGIQKIVVRKKTGKVVVKKGLKAGTYPVKIAVKAAGGDGYQPGEQVVTVQIQVK